jgi:hypothetical protein
MHVLYRPDFYPDRQLANDGAQSPARYASDDETPQRKLARRSIVFVATLRHQPDGCWLFVVPGDLVRISAMYDDGVVALGRC